ncbi:MAG: HD domain-containing protein [Clostridia bacterium]|nr:HD domain-containing protein [Clostridia bacterium]
MLIKEIVQEGRVEGVYMVLDCRRRVARNGKPFADIRLGDRSGEIGLKVWEAPEEIFTRLQKGQVIRLTAAAGSYNNTIQLEADGKEDFYRICQEGEYDPAGFLPVSPVPPAESWRILDEAFAQVKLAPYRELLGKFFQNPSFREEFGRAPAALRHHHAYLGGLLEHTAGVVTICQAAFSHYPHVNPDLLLTGALLHDIGKVRSYAISTGFTSTDEGKLLGHLVLGINMVMEAIAEIRRRQGAAFFPATLELPLLHLLASHHGIMEWGSPVEPVLLEACLLHHADHMDSEAAKYREAVRSGPAGAGFWTPYNQNLKRSVYLPDLQWEAPAAAAEESTDEPTIEE